VPDAAAYAVGDSLGLVAFERGAIVALVALLAALLPLAAVIAAAFAAIGALLALVPGPPLL
jgi:hypothetical protein